MPQNKLRGSEGFERFYFERFGSRWQPLREALLKESTPIAWQVGEDAPYYMDTASIMAAATLPAGGKRILDMCAAPGGKSLVIASLMDADASLVCNERSATRYHRLCRTIDDCLPPAIRERVSTACSDGATMCRRTQGALYDRILLDAPCSSERHVLTDSKYLAMWSPARIKSLSMAQWALVSSAWRMLTPGGYLLYSTCALCTEENDGIIQRLLHKFKDATTDGSLSFDNDCIKGFAPGYHSPIAERTEYGLAVLPGIACGAGPIYFAVVMKTNR